MTVSRIRKAALAIAMTGALPALAMSTPVQAAVPSHAAPVAQTAAYGDLTFDHGRKRGHYKHDRRDRDDDYRRSNYSEYDRYGDPVRRDTRVWRGDNGRYYCQKKNGTTGLLIGGAAGALAGREIAGRGDRTLGAILGAAGGALLGREIDRGGSRCR